MANFELKFLDCYFGKDLTIECKKNYVDAVGIETIEITLINEDSIITIDLNKSTAIKFAKTLRTEINKITESEV